MSNVKNEVLSASAPAGTPPTNESSQKSSATSTLVLANPQFPTVEDALASDAPLRVLMSLRDNPNLALATEEQLEALSMKLRLVACTPQKQEAMRRSEAGEKAPKRARKINPAIAAAANAD